MLQKSRIVFYCLTQTLYKVVLKPPIAELQSAKRASGAPWVRKFGKTMKPEKFGYRVSVRLRTRTDSRGGEGSHKATGLYEENAILSYSNES